MEGAGHESLGLGMLSDKITDNSQPGTPDIGFLDTGRDSEFRQQLTQHIADGSGAIGTDFRWKSTPLLQ